MRNASVPIELSALRGTAHPMLELVTELDHDVEIE
jgi:hypothetical protein